MSLKASFHTQYRPCIFGVIAIRNSLLMFVNAIIGKITSEIMTAIKEFIRTEVKLTHTKSASVWEEK